MDRSNRRSNHQLNHEDYGRNHSIKSNNVQNILIELDCAYHQLTELRLFRIKLAHTHSTIEVQRL